MLCRSLHASSQPHISYHIPPFLILSEFIPLSTKGNILTALHESSLVWWWERCFLEWVSENTTWKTDLYTQPADQPIRALIRVLCGTGEPLGVSLECLPIKNPLKHRCPFPWDDADVQWGRCSSNHVVGALAQLPGCRISVSWGCLLFSVLPQ